MSKLRVRVRSASSLLVLALFGCPRVPATVEVQEPPPSKPAPSSSSSELEPNEFDVNAALDVAEQTLLAIDPLRSRPHPDDFDYERAHTWLPDVGLRSLYYYAGFHRLTVASAGALFGAPVFLDGPHGADPDLTATSYGVYNPEFVARLGKTARALARDPARVERTRGAFERQLRGQALTYLLVYRAIHHDPDWYEGFEQQHAEHLRQIAAGQFVDLSGSPYWHDLVAMVDAFRAAGMDFYETDTAAYFWVRRDLDGTAQLWLEALEALLTAYGVDTRAAPPHVPGR